MAELPSSSSSRRGCARIAPVPGLGQCGSGSRDHSPALEAVLFHELEALEWRIARLEQSIAIRSMRWLGNRAARAYRRLGRFLLHSPLGGISRRVMGSVAPVEQYRRWFRAQSASTAQAQDSIPETTGAPAAVLSIVMPVHGPRLEWLREAVESVVSQSDPRWQLCIVLDGPAPPDVMDYLSGAARRESRLTLVEAAKGGISHALNSGLPACTGAYTGFLDQDDTLEAGAVAELALAIAEHDPDLLYTDEDWMDESGQVSLPNFKPAWSPALLLSCMYMGHFLVVRTDRLRQVGGFRSEHDGAQDYDLVLRLTDAPARVVHIPRVLYHWRQHERSTARHPEAKPYSHGAGAAALAEAVSRRRLAAQVEDGRMPNHYRLKPSGARMDATVIVPTKNPTLLRRLFEALRAHRNETACRLLVVLHRHRTPADAGIRAVAEEFGAQVREYSGPFNFSRMNNLGAAGLTSPLLVFLNDDICVRDDHWLDALCGPFACPSVGVAGARLLYPDGAIQHSGIVLGLADGTGHAGRFQFGSPFWPWLDFTRNVSAVTGACLAVRRELFEDLGGFDERFSNNYNDVDLCLRTLERGLEVVLSGDACLIHDEARTRANGTNSRERVALWRRWAHVLGEADPYYSPNLASHTESIALAPPHSES